MRHALRFFVPSVTRIAVAMITIGVVGMIYGVARTQARHEAVRLEQALCVERLRGLERREPFVERFVKPAQPCEALRLLEAAR